MDFFPLGGEWYIVLAVGSNTGLCYLQVTGRETEEKRPGEE